MKITILLSFIIIYIYSSISVSAFADEEMNKSNDENMFFYYKTEYGALSDDESDLILEAEIVQIDKCTNKITSHIDFCLAAKVLTLRKGSYDRKVIGLLIKRVIPLEPYDTKLYKFKIGEITEIRARKEGDSFIIVDKRIPKY
jgi:hypothetical protein